MKSNHNNELMVRRLECGAFNISKIQDEIKSQLMVAIFGCMYRCFQYFKDTR